MEMIFTFFIDNFIPDLLELLQKAFARVGDFFVAEFPKSFSQRMIKERYASDYLVIAGTSAGAMAMSSTMIYDGSAVRAHLKGEVKFSTGFGLIRNVIIDTQFEKRGRFNRLAQAVAIQPGILGIGLAEDTGVSFTMGIH
jgi:cyanophycinase